MAYVEALGAAAALVALALAFLFVRRALLRRSGGTVELSVRADVDSRHGRGWSLGLARYAGDELLWFRTFSASPRPRRVLRRAELVVVSQRAPSGAETLALSPGAVVLACRDGRQQVEIAMNATAVTGFLSWLESSAPGEAYRGFAAR